MSQARHRRGSVRPAEPAEAAAPERRKRRPLRLVLLLLAGVGAGLALMIGIGVLVGANDVPGRKVEAGTTGLEIYDKNCAACHGPNGEGGSLSIKGPGFRPGQPLAELTFDERVAKIARGRPLNGMPAWKFRITDEEIRQVAAYTQILSGQSPEPTVEDVR